MSHYSTFVISDILKQDILSTLIEPCYKNDIKENLKLKKNFKQSGLVFETLSKFFVGISSIASFASGIYQYQIISFLAGSASVISLVLLQYSSYSYRESKKLALEINNILKSLNIEQYPVSKNNSYIKISDETSNSSQVSEPMTPSNNHGHTSLIVDGSF